MKIINLNESQYGRLFEAVTDSDFGQNSNPEFFNQNQISNQPKITDKNGATINANPKSTKDKADDITPQQWGSVGGRRSSNTI
jgi:hypothetical protein